MDSLSSRSQEEDELSRASSALAQFFDGVVITDEDCDDTEDMHPVEVEYAVDFDTIEEAELFDAALTSECSSECSEDASTLAQESADLEAICDEAVEQAAEPELEQPEVVCVQDVRLQVSLNQLREWYAIARALGRSDRLVRIAQLGSKFKHAFGDAEPDRPHPFTVWSAKEVEWWLEDLAEYQSCERSLVHPYC